VKMLTHHKHRPAEVAELSQYIASFLPALK
jgi:hypothetical protein